MSLRVTGISQPEAAVTALSADSSGRLVAENSTQLFSGNYSRAGNDLYISADGAPDLYVPGYFSNGTPADIFDSAGAVIRGDTVAQLAGPAAPAQYAQTGGSQAPGASPIGQVETLAGETTVQRLDGSVEVLQVGSKIYQQDVVQTSDGGAVSITFVDGTIFTLASASRMVIDELIYDPQSNENSGGFSLLQGSFVFIAGQVAKTGDMEVSTPSSTMGIRGTTVLVEVTADGGVVTSAVTLTRDPDGSVGRVELRDTEGNLVATLTDTNTKWLVSSAGGETREVVRTLQDDVDDNLLIAEAFAAFRSAVSRVDSGDTFVTLSDPGGAALDSISGTGDGNSFGVDAIDEPDAIEQLPDVEADDADDFEPFDDGELQPDLSEEPPVFTFTGFEDASEDDAITGVIDVEGGVGELTYALGTPPGSGSVTVGSDGSFDFVPAPDFNGTETFTFSVSDETGATTEAIVIVTVLPVNDDPVAADAAATVPEDGILIGTAPASDVDGDVLVFSVVSGPSDGEIALLSDGTYSYTPDTDFAGTDSFEFRVTDPAGATSQGTVTFSVTGTADAPFVVTEDSDVSGALTVTETAATVSGTLVADDPDEGDTLTWTGAATATPGSFSVEPDGTWTFTLDPAGARSIAAGATDEVVFTALVTDASGETAEQQVTITLTGINDAPEVSDEDSALTGAIEEAAEAATISGTLVATDVDGPATLTWTIAATAAVYGTFAVTPDGVWSYTIDNELADPLRAGETVTETLTVTVSDEFGASDSETVSVTVTGTNDVPIVSRVSVFETTEETAVSGALTATDIDGAGTFSFAAGTDAPDNGSVSIAADGTFTYTPDEGFVGVDRFTYVVTDEDGGETTGVAEVEVEKSDVEIDGLSISIGLSTEAVADTAAGAIEIDIEGEISPAQINLSVLLDSSGSIPVPLWNSLLASVDEAMSSLAALFAGTSTSIEVQFTSFGTFTASSPVLSLTDPGLSDAILSLPYTGTGTNWQVAFREAADFLLEEPAGETNYLLFVTDGRPTSGGWETALAELTDPADGRDPVDVSAFGFGDVDITQLQGVDPDAVLFDGPSDLTTAIEASSLFTPELVGLSVQLESDGVSFGVVADETSPALLTEDIDYELPLAAIENIADMLGEDNRITITAQFDTDGDESTAEIELSSFDAFGRADTAQSLTGLDGDDLLFGSNEDDTVNAGAGNDVILTFDGDDTINAGAGDDTVLAGAGDDRIIATEMPAGNDVVRGGAGRDVFEADVADITALLAATELSGIEAIDMDNGRSDTLALSLTDIVSLSDTADTELEALLDAALPESVTIYGNSGDRVDVSTGSGESLLAASAGPVTDAGGNQFTIYEYVDSGGEVLATLAVESEVAVASDGATV
ncbi:Ig-like domain-containing protein [uncultured Roseobacter sp.]|uniref:Ig-like domain-containing protein n=1 Tax=uncultured Roseobacter sp. TaxID=114847 RepID=UPI002621C4E4|nr:Ig-like domain-containing protein [uncultured Roseobacter sp.]